MDSTWQAFQWFDTEPQGIRLLSEKCNLLKSVGESFDYATVEEMLKKCPVSDVDLQQVVDQFNYMLQNLPLT